MNNVNRVNYWFDESVRQKYVKQRNELSYKKRFDGNKLFIKAWNVTLYLTCCVTHTNNQRAFIWSRNNYKNRILQKSEHNNGTIHEQS